MEFVIEKPDVFAIANIEDLHIRKNGPASEMLFICKANIKSGIRRQSKIINFSRINFKLSGFAIRKRIGKIAGSRQRNRLAGRVDQRESHFPV